MCDATSCTTGCCTAAQACATRSTSTCGPIGAACVDCGPGADTCQASGACACGSLAPCTGGLRCVGGACVTASTDWTARAIAQPTPVYASAVAWDSARQRLVLFGGRVASMARIAETWELGPAGWVQRTPTVAPPARSGHDLAYDPMRQRVVLFGGFPDTGVRFGDTWEWDGTTWSQRSPSASPSARSGHRMAWDPVRGHVVLFGGRVDGSSNFYQSDTWSWNGTTWTLLASTGPIAREGVALAWDPGLATGRLVLFGGTINGGPRNDTWAWDGTGWTQVTTTAAPAARVFHAMTYSPALGKLLLFGGSTGTSASATFYGDTWVFDRTTWTQIAPATMPGARNGHALDFDPSRNRVTLIGGWNNTSVLADQWEY